MTAVLGIDPSLTRTGLCWATGPGEAVLGQVESAGHKGDSWEARLARLDGIEDRASEWVWNVGVRRLTSKPDLVVVEGPSYGSSTGQQWDRAGLWWKVYDLARILLGPSQPPLVVSPSQRMIYATGKGTAGKDEVLAAVVRRYPEVPVANNDQADALVLAAIGMRWLGQPMEVSLPQSHLRAMSKLPTSPPAPVAL